MFENYCCLDALKISRNSYQTELSLENFFKAVKHLEVAERVVNKSSLSKARKKLLFNAFIELNHTMTEQFYSNFQSSSWYGFNLMAVDGTTLRVPDEPEIVKHFGFWNVTKGKRCPKARGSQMFDVLNKITIDTIISPKAHGERELAAFHFLKLMPTDLVLLDRGYPVFWLFKLILSMDANFCARISCTKWKVVRKFETANIPHIFDHLIIKGNYLCKSFFNSKYSSFLNTTTKPK